MDIKEVIRLALRNLIRRKIRSGLTVIGIVIGIMAILSLISLSQGLEESIAGQFARIGSNNILITQKGLSGPPIGSKVLSNRDVEFLRKFNEFDKVLPLYTKSAEIEFNNQKIISLISGTDADLSDERIELLSLEFEKGRNLGESSSGSVIIGHGIAENTFDKKIFVNSKIKIEDKSFRVVGILKKEGGDFDGLIALTGEDIKDLFDIGDTVNAINGRVKEGVDINSLVDKVKEDLEDFRNAEDIEVQTPADLQEQFSNIIGVVSIIVIGIAAISLVVGGIGIANSMFTSVLERTKEIGIMKAIGARNSEILSIFLAEAAIIGLFGGSIGIVLGISIAYLIKLVASLGGVIINISFQLNIVLFALAFSMIIGIVSGLWPAVQASKQKPIDSLRYE
jgi:putative ABC transport system permease protein